MYASSIFASSMDIVGYITFYSRRHCRLALSALQACTLEALQRWLSKQLQDQVLGDTAIFGCLVTVSGGCKDFGKRACR